MRSGNLFSGSTPPPSGETFEALLEHRNLVVERIVSSDGPKSGVYVQPQDEWVLLLRGRAVLRVQGRRMELEPGDHVFLPAGEEHLVEETSGGALWLAVHLHPQEAQT